MLAWGVRRRKQTTVGAIIVANAAVIILAFIFIVVSRADASGRLTSFSADSFVSASAGSFSNKVCAASGATATRIFVPSGLQSDDSAADNTKALQRTINKAAAAGGGIVTVPAGTFYIDGHIRLKKNVELTGVGPSTVLKAGPRFLDSNGPDGGYPLITTAGASDTTVSDLTADESGNTLDANAHESGRVAAYLIDVRDSKNVVVDGVATRNPFTYSIAVVGSSDFCVTHSSTRVATSGRYYWLDGIHVLDSHTGQVIGNDVDQRVGTDGDDGLVAHTIHAAVYDVLYADNTVRGGNDGDGMQFAVGNHPIYNVVIRNNVFWGSPFGIRTGYWNTGSNGAVHNIVISDNYIHNLVPGHAFPLGGNAVNIGGFGRVAPVTYVVATGNRACHAGKVTVVRGTGNAVAGTKGCSLSPSSYIGIRCFRCCQRDECVQARLLAVVIGGWPVVYAGGGGEGPGTPYLDRRVQRVFL